MSSLQLGLIAAGVVLVVGVMIFNVIQERRVRRRIREAFEPGAEPSAAARAQEAGARRSSERVEPTLGAEVAATEAGPTSQRGAPAARDEPFEAPVDVQASIASDVPEDVLAEPRAAAASLAPGVGATVRVAPQPDPDIECVVALQPTRPVVAGALAAGLHARLGRPVRWFGRRNADAPWQLLRSDTTGEFAELRACLLLANRVGAAGQPMLDAFVRVVGDVAASLPAAFEAPDTAAEAARAEALDRICADLDVQIGLTLLRNGGATIPGTRLRGIAEAAGFRLADGGRFDWVQEDSGAVLYSLQNYRPEPFTAETLRISATPGAVFLLDVPRVADPVRVYDQMRLSARRMAQTLDATLVDDNRRPLDDAALNAIRDQVKTTAAALREAHIEAGSARALALFGA